MAAEQQQAEAEAGALQLTAEQIQVRSETLDQWFYTHLRGFQLAAEQKQAEAEAGALQLTAEALRRAAEQKQAEAEALQRAAEQQQAVEEAQLED